MTKKAKSKSTAKSKASAKKSLSSKKKAAPKKKAATKSKAKPASKAKAKPKARGKPEAKAKTSPPKKAPKTAKPKAKKPRAEKAMLTPPKKVSGGKALPKGFLIDVAKAIRDAVRPLVMSGKGRDIVGTATSGDATFHLDKVAEKALLSFLREAHLPVAYYSEDAGYATFASGQPQHLLVVDPIDGTRAAKCGFEGCVVSVSSTRVIERPSIGDVDKACVAEIVQPRVFYAERGKGARTYLDGQYKKPKLSKSADLENLAWAMTVPARPAELIFPTVAKLVDLSSLKGSFFACNSTSYSLTRLLTNQLDACVDIANRYFRDIGDAVKDHFINAGRGAILGIAPYDISASVLIAQEAGAIVTDAYGNSLDEVLLLDSSVANQRSLVAASNADLHDKLMSFLDIRIRQFEQLLKRRAARS